MNAWNGRLHFADEPDRFARMRALFPVVDTRRVIHATADSGTVGLVRDAKGRRLRGGWRALLKWAA
jgi:hypothetical protein